MTSPQISPAAAPGTLDLVDVEVGYGSTFTLGGVSFCVGPGEVVGFIGPNGGGKSTLLKAIAGVLPLRNGRITLGGESLHAAGGHIAFVPQREDVNWEFPATALDVVRSRAPSFDAGVLSRVIYRRHQSLR